MDFVKCEPSELCNYTTDFLWQKWTTKVETNLFDTLKIGKNAKLLDNNCHTLIRKDCSDKISAK